MKRYHLHLIVIPLLAIQVPLGCGRDDDSAEFPCNCRADQVCQNGVCVTPDGGLDAGDGDSGRDDTGNNPRCPANGTIISEILYEPETEEPEWVELIGAGGTDLAGFRLIGINGNNGDAVFNIGLTGSIGSEGRFLIASAEMEGTDQVNPDLNMQNSPDSLTFTDCDGDIVDAIGYGEFSGEEVFAGEGSPAPDGSRGESLARCPGAIDTNNNSLDFHISVEPTPKTVNGNFEDPFGCTECVGGSFAGRVIINEVLYNPGGDDTTDAEFVELAATAGTDLFGLVLDFVNGSNGDAYQSIAMSGVVGSSGFFVVGRTDGDMPLSATIQNGPDSIRLVDCAGEAVDAVGYGAFSGEEVFAGETSPAAGAGSDFSLARCADSVDSGDNSIDFFEATPTPSAINAGFTDPTSCGGSQCLAGSLVGQLVINELRISSALTWVELYAVASADLTDAQILFTSAGSDVIAAAFGEHGLPEALAVGQYVVVASGDIPGFEGEIIFDGLEGRPILALDPSAGVVTLDNCLGETVDSLRWGNESLVGGEQELAPAPTESESTARCGDSGDTDDNSVDFVTSSSPSPGAQNDGFDMDECVACIPIAEGIVVINEFLPDEDGDEGAVEQSFVELRGTPGLCLDDLRLDFVNGTATGNTYESHDLAGDLPADGYFVIGESDVANLDDDASMNIQNGPDNIVLYDGDDVIDAVGYGTFADDGTFAGEGSAVATSGLSGGDGVGRCPTEDVAASDTENNSLDFKVFDGSTPGEANPSCN